MDEGFGGFRSASGFKAVTSPVSLQAFQIKCFIL